jgi:hypothetical protein
MAVRAVTCTTAVKLTAALPAESAPSPQPRCTCPKVAGRSAMVFGSCSKLVQHDSTAGWAGSAGLGSLQASTARIVWPSAESIGSINQLFTPTT